jgi:hypothetical protein
MVAGLITELDIDGIISDNRLGVLEYLLFYNASIERYDRNTTWLTSKIHQKNN